MTRFEIEIQNDLNYLLDPASLTEAAEVVLNAHEVDMGSAMTVVITENEEVAKLNRQFRGVDSPTDVLSFPMDAPPMPGESPYLGDLVIAYPYAEAQAEREGFSMQDGLILLVVHGTLHLLGYDHGDAEERAAMWSAQEKALIALGVPISIVPRLEESDKGDHP